MKTFFILSFIVVLTTLSAFAQTPRKIHYQGVLNDQDTNPVNGPKEMEFRLYDDSLATATLLWSQGPQTVVIHKGIFNVNLGPFPEEVDFSIPYYLELVVEGDVLSPREALASAPYSLRSAKSDSSKHSNKSNHSNNSDNTKHAEVSDSLADNSVISKMILDGTIQLIDIGQNSAVIGQVIKWDGTTWVASNDDIGAGGSYLPLTGGIMTGPISNSDDPEITMGKGNFGLGNQNPGLWSFVAGRENIVWGDYSTISGGSNNYAYGHNSTIGGGDQNSIEDNIVVDYSTISGGHGNHINDVGCTIGGGVENNTYDEYTTIAGGQANHARTDGSTIGGGYFNEAGEGPGLNGYCSTIPGGFNNRTIGTLSFAAGHYALAQYDGSFVWADAFNQTDPNPDHFSSERDNQFRIRANGGGRFDVNNDNWVNIYDDGHNLISTSVGARLTLGGVWTNTSDKNLKENFTPLDKKMILEKLTSLPITMWNYKSEDPSVKHLGPTAQDFYGLFGLGADDKSISTIDPSGIALVAIQQLKEENNSLREEIDLLKEQVKQLMDLNNLSYDNQSTENSDEEFLVNK